MKVRFITGVLLSLNLCFFSAIASTDVADKVEQNPEQLASVLALDADVEFGAYLAGECLTCHTPTTTNEAIPHIHGKDKAYLASAILEYKHKQRDNDVMRGITAALSVDEIAAIATYLSEQ